VLVVDAIVMKRSCASAARPEQAVSPTAAPRRGGARASFQIPRELSFQEQAGALIGTRTEELRGRQIERTSPRSR
jgi:hypothetical protein